MTASTPAPSSDGATRAPVRTPAPENAPTGRLIAQLTEQISSLVRNEARLAQAEVTQKAERMDVQQAAPPVPTQAIAGVQADIQTVKTGLSR